MNIWWIASALVAVSLLAPTGSAGDPLDVLDTLERALPEGLHPVDSYPGACHGTPGHNEIDLAGIRCLVFDPSYMPNVLWDLLSL